MRLELAVRLLKAQEKSSKRTKGWFDFAMDKSEMKCIEPGLRWRHEGL